jgi:hypothetical protein
MDNAVWRHLLVDDRMNPKKQSIYLDVIEMHPAVRVLLQ